jgi:V/A-type H+/Na+-transporting ATPase subunit C
MTIGLEAPRYASVNARMRGLYAQLLDEERWRNLLLAESLPAALETLRGTVYEQALASGEQGLEPSLERIERRLLGKVADDCRRVITFMSGAARQLIIVWWQHFELENLKAVFRGLDQKMPPAQIEQFLIPLGDYETLPWEALLHEHSLAGVVERLSDSHYINPLRAAYPIYQREGSMFPLEVALDIRYYRDIVVASNRLGRAEREEARQVFGTHLDILNILWAFRYRVYYGLSAEEIVNYTLWHTIHTDADVIQAIALGATPQEIVERVWGPGKVDLSALEGLTSESAMIPALEMALLRHWRALAHQKMLGFPFRLGASLGFLVLSELEVQDLVTVLEGKSLRWDRARIQQHLIRVEE